MDQVAKPRYNRHTRSNLDSVTLRPVAASGRVLIRRLDMPEPDRRRVRISSEGCAQGALHDVLPVPPQLCLKVLGLEERRVRASPCRWASAEAHVSARSRRFSRNAPEVGALFAENQKLAVSRSHRPARARRRSFCGWHARQQVCSIVGCIWDRRAPKRSSRHEQRRPLRIRRRCVRILQLFLETSQA